MELERQLAEYLDLGKKSEAATLALRTWGDELFGFLVYHLRDDVAASDVFSQLTEDFWRSLSTFRRRCSVRTWLYLLARNAAARYRQTPWNAAGRRTGDAAFDAMVASFPSRTPVWMQTEVKDRFGRLREALEPDDQSLLVLRVDRGLQWDDIALIFLQTEMPEAMEIKRESARLRKRFQAVKAELHRMAVEAGLKDDITD